jgi:SAM-dependent methyltransferase
MLAKAKELAEGLDISWIESDVSDTGLPLGSYDVILSQHGYHYFPDKTAALNEFRRLLVAGGRMAYSIWDGHSPYTRALCNAVERHISPEIANKQRSQRTTPTAKELSAQASDAGFSGVEVHRHELMIDVPLASEFVPLHLRSMPIAAAFLELDNHSQSKLATDVSVAMESFTHAGRLVYPDAINIVVGVA